MSEFTFSLC